jgi:hypothetical protein
VDAALAVKAVVEPTVTELTCVQPFASVTVHVYVPAASPVIAFVPSPVGFPGVQLYEYAPVPPVTEIEAVPLLKLQVAGVELTVEVIAVGCVMLNVCVMLQVGVPDEMVTV